MCLILLHTRHIGLDLPLSLPPLKLEPLQLPYVPGLLLLKSVLVARFVEVFIERLLKLFNCSIMLSKANSWAYRSTQLRLV